ncbi:putative FAD dependent oxidoreductase [Xylona heveae TC161]|uniref:L-2-hydroxyglutarate dehydrogenase, mitochondrial n=1 Tax=Xylona heveae (strain CBS 132557 / TC161) TaxID=1328760 RepID=A0A165HFI1_XYLHT|nr:putative FAD dependent oxidoreductase [Xylona heveae TC161]KZF23434.1 putative FAD dependent oxidoreductase [Xylona heveae TC161]
MLARTLRAHFSGQLKSACRGFSTSSSCRADLTHAVIGGGVVGLAIARKLAEREGTSTVIIERHSSVGTETSSRNSEVIHAGLYYGPDSLKSKLCIQGKHMLYDLCERNSIPCKKTGKWIVAQTPEQWEECEKIHSFTQSLGVPTRFVSAEEAQRREPDVRAEAGILESPTTGIVDSHSLMSFLQAEFEDRGGMCAFQANVTGLKAIDGGKGGYEITISGGGSGANGSTGSDASPASAQDSNDNTYTITAETVINSAGLGACYINNLLLPADRHRVPFFAKGSYFSYSAPHPRPSTLIYPAPSPGHGGLGTHLTLDLTGRVRFGPDVEWVDDPNDLRPNPARLDEAIEHIRAYLPGIKPESIGLDYCGIRPKLGKLGAVASAKGFQDFVIQKEDGFDGFVNLLGIESPGLTSSLAIAEMVHDLLYAER